MKARVISYSRIRGIAIIFGWNFHLTFDWFRWFIINHDNLFNFKELGKIIIIVILKIMIWKLIYINIYLLEDY